MLSTIRTTVSTLKVRVNSPKTNNRHVFQLTHGHIGPYGFSVTKKKKKRQKASIVKPIEVVICSKLQTGIELTHLLCCRCILMSWKLLVVYCFCRLHIWVSWMIHIRCSPVLILSCLTTTLTA